MKTIRNDIKYMNAIDTRKKKSHNMVSFKTEKFICEETDISAVVNRNIVFT